MKQLIVLALLGLMISALGVTGFVEVSNMWKGRSPVDSNWHAVQPHEEPPPIELDYCDYEDTMRRFACLVRASAEGSTRAHATPELLGIYLGLATMQTVQTLASAGRYSLWVGAGDKQKPGMAEQVRCLAEGFGICGNHVYLFVKLIRMNGFQAREVQMYFELDGRRQSHAAAEIYVDGKWRFFDVTWGSVWVDEHDRLKNVLSFNEALAGKGKRLTSETDAWFAYANDLHNPFSYLGIDDLDFVIGGHGTVTPPFKVSSDGITTITKLEHVPSYVGDNQEDNDQRRISYRLLDPLKRNTFNVAIEVRGVGGCETGEILLNQERRDPKVGQVIFAEVPNGAILTIDGPDDVCYTVIERIELTSVGHF